MYNLMPDSVLFGSLLLYFLTQNSAYGAFSVFIVEMTVAHRVIAWFFSSSVGSPDTQKPVQCRAGYKTPRLDITRMFDHDPYPSYGIFSIVSMATYLGFAMNEYTSVLTSMGEDWKSRSMIAYIFMGLIVATFIMARMFLSSCGDTLGEIIVASIFAVVVGAIFFYVNKKLLGKEATNMLGLPYMSEKDAKGNGIFICAAV